MIRDMYERSANFVAHLGAWGLEQVEHGLGAANKRLFDSRAHDGGSDNSSAERVLPAYADGDVVGDTFVLFDAPATWSDAGEHVLGSGRTVVGKEDELYRPLEALPKSPRSH